MALFSLSRSKHRQISVHLLVLVASTVHTVARIVPRDLRLLKSSSLKNACAVNPRVLSCTLVPLNQNVMAPQQHVRYNCSE